MPTLEIRDLHVSVETKEGAKPILRGVDLTINSGETHAIMGGPNGSGKSTLASALAGHPKYTVTSGTVTLDGEDLLAMTVDERARAGSSSPCSTRSRCPACPWRTSCAPPRPPSTARRPPCARGGKEVKGAMENLRIDSTFAERSVNEGFSGGEKKRHEILQMELFKPHFAILDETDSGLDVDALRVVSEGVNRAKANTDVGVLLITHYTRILRYIKPDFVHVFVDGKIAEEGGPRARGAARGERLRQVRRHRRDDGLTSSSSTRPGAVTRRTA